jgi:Family of unknown function (DUF6230)
MVMGSTNWRRFGVVGGLTVGAAVGVVFLVSSGAVAASFTVSGQPFKVSADELTANNFVQYGYLDHWHENGADPDDMKFEPVAISAMENATLTNLCQSVYTDLGPLSVTLVIHAGDTSKGDKPVTAKNMVVDMTQLDGDATFNDMEIGKDAGALVQWPGDPQGEIDQRQPSAFSQQARSIKITNLRQVARATSAGQFNLNGLSLRLLSGKKECFPG